MKIVVIGGTGLIGSKVVSKLRQKGHEAIAAAPSTGVNTITGEGLAEAFMNTEVVVDLSNSPDFEEKAATVFFETATKNLLAAETNASVRHHVILSVVGTERLNSYGYFKAKQRQEDLVKGGGIPYTIIHSTQFMEFLPQITSTTTEDGTVHLSTANIQPIAAEDVASFVVDILLEGPTNRIVEIGGPEKFSMAELGERYLESRGDERLVTGDANALYFGYKLEPDTLIPSVGARLSKQTVGEWIDQQLQKA
ncbi:SDR family oxidoreductase [Terrimonas sp. NA20]|uniref:SDR family oxidoreductase n=1 Tax=Terrimonas ginsenosidimutans TaxID=2908004 RepID=A0ABS9KUF5_9BACT|nr:SDR family oxidoreductase [Terrimonas ginsenosidimutans]MCG2615930.1 SDR family oxidoreductase [Terrimonas ginsenosidimutans]